MVLDSEGRLEKRTVCEDESEICSQGPVPVVTDSGEGMGYTCCTEGSILRPPRGPRREHQSHSGSSSSESSSESSAESSEESNGNSSEETDGMSSEEVTEIPIL